MKITKIGTWNSLERRQKVNNANTGTQKNNFVSPAFGVFITPKMGVQAKSSQYLQALEKMTPDMLKGKLQAVDEALNRQIVAHKAKINEINDRFLPFKNYSRKSVTEEFSKDYQELLNEKEMLLEAFQERTFQIGALAWAALKGTDSFRAETLKAQSSRADYETKDTFRNRKGFASIAGYDRIKSLLEGDIISTIKAERTGADVDVPGSILFFGPQGNGKSSFAKAFAHEAGARVVVLKQRKDTKNSKESYTAFIDKLYKTAQEAKQNFETTDEFKNQRTIIIIDEFDDISDKNSAILPQLEKFLETCSKEYHCTVFATSNYPDRIKLPMDNDSIFPFRVGMDPATVDDKKKILEFYMDGRNTEPIDYPKVVNKLLEREKESGDFYSNGRLRKIAINSDSESRLLELIDKLAPNITKKQYDEYQNLVKKLSKGKTVL